MLARIGASSVAGSYTPSPSSGRNSNRAPPTIRSSSVSAVPWSSTLATMIGGATGGCSVAVGEAVPVGVAVGAGVGLAVGVTVGVAVAVGVGVGVAVAVGV